MRHLLSALAALSMLGAGAVVASPASARDFPYCLQGRETGIPGDCQYRSYRECRSSASGRDASCGRNPAYAYRHQRETVAGGKC
jgi:hypothetical protein